MACGWLLTGAACNPKLLVPPARALGGESPAVLPAGAVSGGMTASVLHESGLFDETEEFNARLFAAHLTAGLGMDLDARLTATFASMSAPDEEGYEDYFEEADLDKDLRAATLRVKWNPGRNPFLSFSGAGGYGSWAGRGYYSGEWAVIFGTENPYFVPYLNFRSAYNTPVRRDSVRWADSPQWDSHAEYTLPSRSKEIILGFKVPLRAYKGPARREQNRNPPYVSLEFGLMELKDARNGFMGSTIALDFHVPLRHARKQPGAAKDLPGP